LVEDEHPQVITALLMLDPEPAAESSVSPAAAHSSESVVERVAVGRDFSSGSVGMIDGLLSQRINGANAFDYGQPREAVNISANLGAVRSTILPSIAAMGRWPGNRRNCSPSKCCSTSIENERLLRDVDNEALSTLKGTKTERDPFFVPCQPRRRGIRDEIAGQKLSRQSTQRQL
jgi:flagellar motor switch protein FliG